MTSIIELEKKWGTPFVKNGISKEDKVGHGQIWTLNKYFNKHPVQVMELIRIVVGNEIDSIVLPNYFNKLMRWEANWILGRIISYFSKSKKISSPNKNKVFSKHPISKFSSKSSINYYEYIESPEWKEKSAQAKVRAKNRCQICYRPASKTVILHTHHRTYLRLGHELDSDLTVLCAGCHKLYEDNKKSPKYY